MLFIDEIDTIAPARERQQDLSASGVSSRLISTLASELDNNQGTGRFLNVPISRVLLI